MLLHTSLSFLAPVVGFMPAKKADAPSEPVDPKSIDGFIAWCEKMPANKKYIWSNWKVCLLAQWGETFRQEGTNPVFNYPLATGISEKWGEAACKNGTEIHIAHPRPHTFGAAAKRARKFKRKYGL